MDDSKRDDEGLFIFTDEHDINSMMDNFDDMLKDPLASWHVGGVDVQDVLMDLSKDGNASEMQNPLSDVDTLLNKPASTPYSGLNIYDSTEMYDVVNSSNSIPKCQDSTLLRRPQGSKERLQQIHPIQSSFVKIESKVANIQSAPELIKLLRNHETKVPSKQAIVNHIIGTDISQKVQSTSSCHLVPVQAIPVKTHPAQCPPVQSLPVQADQSVPSVSVPSVSVPCVSVQSGLVQSVPVQTLPLQSPQILISPHRTSSVQLCSLLPKHTEEQGSAAVVALPSTQPSPDKLAVTSTQVVSPTSQQVPVQQLILHTQLPDSTAAVQGPLQIVIDPTKLPITCNVPPKCPTAAPPKVERHRAHNAIEKKYRTSINDKILEMKNLLFGADAKIQKSGVLKKAIDHIKHLRNVNSHLRQENMSFRIRLQQLGALTCVKSEDSDQMRTVEVLPAPLTPDSTGDVHSSSGSSSSTPPSSPCKSDESLAENVAMLDRTRVGLCIIMFAFFIFDPFNLVFSWQKGLMKEYGSNQPAAFHGGSGRLLLSDGSLENQLPSPSPRAWFLFNLLGWFSRLLVIGFIFLKLFVFGEPSLRPESGVAAKFWAFKRQADLATKRGEHIAASKILSGCLETLGRPLPTSRLDVACSLLWHMFRQILHRLWIGRWLSAKASKYLSFRSADKKEVMWVQQSAKQASLVYHELHQLYLTGRVAGNSWLATVIALNAVNLAEMADKNLDEEKVVEIYVDAAIQLRSTLPKHLQFLARYFLSRARRLCRGHSLTLPYSCWWLFTSVGHRFFVSGEWSCKSVPQIWNSSKRNENKPLVNVTQAFCRFLLEQALTSLLLPRASDPGSSESRRYNSHDNTGSIQAQDYLHTLAECVNNSRSSGINRNIEVFGEKTSWPSQETDLVGCWWTAVGKVASCWLVGDTDGAQKQYEVIENIPEEIENNDDPVGKALLMAFRARVRVLRNKNHKTDCTHEALECCDRGGALLRESIAFASLHPENHLLKLMHLLCCDWLLSTRSEVWEREVPDGGHHVSISGKLDGFDKDLKSLQKVCFYLPEALPKVYMYQATFRMVAGASPIQTQRLLQRSIMPHSCETPHKPLGGTDISSSLTTEKDRANALLMASKHLPTSLFSNSEERKGMVLEAVESLQKIGEKDRITRCRKLLLSM